jgi:hypothetical protein
VSVILTGALKVVLGVSERVSLIEKDNSVDWVEVAVPICDIVMLRDELFFVWDT